MFLRSDSNHFYVVWLLIFTKLVHRIYIFRFIKTIDAEVFITVLNTYSRNGVVKWVESQDSVYIFMNQIWRSNQLSPGNCSYLTMLVCRIHFEDIELVDAHNF